MGSTAQVPGAAAAAAGARLISAGAGFSAGAGAASDAPAQGAGAGERRFGRRVRDQAAGNPVLLLSAARTKSLRRRFALAS